MKLYVILINEVAWVQFFDNHPSAYGYLHNILPDKLKNENSYFIDSPKTYFRNGRLFFSYENTLTGDDEKHVYSIEEISLVDALNWLAEAKENKWIR